MRLFSARPLRTCIVYAFTAGLGVSPAWAQQSQSIVRSTAEPSGELTLKKAIEAAIARNPDLVANAFDLKAAEARIAQANVRPNPEFSAQLENFAGTGVARGADSLETTLSLSQVIEMGGKRGYRTSVASADRDLVGVERQSQQLDVLAEVTRRFVALVAAQSRLGLATSAREISQRTLDAISARVQAARSPEAERSRAQIAFTRASVEEQQAQSEVRAARFALSALWGSSAPSFSQASADLMTLEPVQAFDLLAGRLERSPDFLRFASQSRLRDAELQLARARARPDLTFGVGVRRLSQTADTALVASFSMPLPVFDRNRGAIREAEVRRAQNDALRDAAFLRARATVYGLYQELLATRSRFETLQNDALVQAQRALDQTQFGYDRGRFSYLELATAQQELIELRAAILDAAADYHQILTEIERLTGEPVAAETP